MVANPLLTTYLFWAETCRSMMRDYVMLWSVYVTITWNSVRKNVSSGRIAFRMSLTSECVKQDFEKVRAVQEMEAPRNVSELQTFMGFITYLAKFLPNLSEVSAPLRSLLQTEVEWHWDSEQENSLVALKKLVTDTPVLSYYDPKKPLVLTVDASSKGLGTAVVQEGRPIAYASPALTSSQQNYAQIEKKALAIAFGCDEFHRSYAQRSQDYRSSCVACRDVKSYT